MMRSCVLALSLACSSPEPREPFASGNGSLLGSPADTGELADTGDPSEPEDTGDSSDTADLGDSSDTADTGDSLDTGE